MDDDDIDLIKKLRTKIGCIVEDCSAAVLIWSNEIPVETRIEELSIASTQIDALTAAARALLRLKT